MGLSIRRRIGSSVLDEFNLATSPTRKSPLLPKPISVNRPPLAQTIERSRLEGKKIDPAGHAERSDAARRPPAPHVQFRHFRSARPGQHSGSTASGRTEDQFARGKAFVRDTLPHEIDLLLDGRSILTRGAQTNPEPSHATRVRCRKRNTGKTIDAQFDKPTPFVRIPNRRREHSRRKVRPRLVRKLLRDGVEQACYFNGGQRQSSLLTLPAVELRHSRHRSSGKPRSTLPKSLIVHPRRPSTGRPGGHSAYRSGQQEGKRPALTVMQAMGPESETIP